MAGITLEQAQAKLDAYLAAETKVLAGQSYEIGDRKLTRADLTEIRNGIEVWNNRVIGLSASLQGRGRSRVIVPRG
jgi:hypothetical protein